MKIRVRVTNRDESEQALVKIALASAAAHVVGLIVFSVMPRFMTPPVPPRTTIAEIIPASALFPGSPAPTPPAPSGPSPSQRAQEARAAQQPPPPEKPKPETPKVEPPKPAKPAPSKPAEKPKSNPSVPPLPGAEPAEPPPAEAVTPPSVPAGPAAPSRGPVPGPADGGGVTFGGNDVGGSGGIPGIGSSAFPYDYYRSSLVAILQSNWRRPVSPEGLGDPLSCRVSFTILKSGIIQDPQVSVPSGNDALDRSALRAVYASNPLPPLPFQYGHGSVSAEVVFKLTSD